MIRLVLGILMLFSVGACSSFSGNEIEQRKMSCLKEFLEINITARGSVDACEWVMSRRS